MKTTSNSEIIKIIKGIWLNTNRKRRIQLLFLFITMLLSGVAELFSIAIVVPFLSILFKPEGFNNIPILNNIFNSLGVESYRLAVIIAMISFIIIVILSSGIRLCNLWLSKHISASIGSDFSIKAYYNTLTQPYTYHLNNNSSSIIAATTSYIGTTIATINLILMFMTSVIISLFMFIILFKINYLITITAIFTFGLAYIILGFTAKRKLLSNSKLLSRKSILHIQSTQEGLGLIKDIILSSSQKKYLNDFSLNDRSLRKVQAESSFLAAFPKLALEAIGLILIVVLAFSLSQLASNTNPEVVISSLGAFALGSQKLLPAFQAMYAAWAGIKASTHPVLHLLSFLNSHENSEEYNKYINKTYSQYYIIDTNTIEFKNCFFSYDNQKYNLSDINFLINKGDSIGIIGSTGSGKSTFINLLMGLLKPSKGKVIINNVDIYNYNTNYLKNWTSSIAYVPQEIYLTDKTIAENIAINEDYSEINFNKVLECCRIAQLDSFIQGLSFRYDHIVGEKGIKFSGGQRQRLGIARALYNDPKILIMDEATSALDDLTESQLISKLYEFKKDITLIMVAHRMSSLINCDRLIKIENGTLINIDRNDIKLK